MPKDSIERAIKKGTGELQGQELVELTYEAIAPGGVALIIEVLTDNRNRTGGEIRSIIEKRGGSLGKANSVLWKFDRQGIISVSAADATEEQVFEAAIEAGADNVEAAGDAFDVSTKVDDFDKVRASLQAFVQKKRQKPDKKWGEAEDERPIFTRSEIVYTPKAPVRVDGERAQQVLELINDLEDHEDVQNVYGDFDIPEEILQKMS